MKVWITKYALTQGVFEAEAKITNTDPRMIAVRFPGEQFDQYFHKPDWHKTYEEAKKQTENMLEKKIESLKKQLKKLEALRCPSQ